VSFFKLRKEQPAGPEVIPGSELKTLGPGESLHLTDPVFELTGAKGHVFRVNVEVSSDDPNYVTVLKPDGRMGLHGAKGQWLFTIEPATFYVTSMAEGIAEEERARQRAGQPPKYPTVGTTRGDEK